MNSSKLINEKFHLIKILLILSLIIILILNKLNSTIYSNSYTHSNNAFNQTTLDTNFEHDKWSILLITKNNSNINFDLFSGFRIIVIDEHQLFLNNSQKCFISKQKHYKKNIKPTKV